MRILGIETSCDETGAAVIEAVAGDKKVKLLSNVVTSSLALHAKTGGIIPEVAAREQLKYIIPVIEQALRSSTRGVDAQNPAGLLDAIAVTVGPGLLGSLLVGVETAKTLAYVWKKPIIPVNHLIGHVYANFIDWKFAVNQITLPAIALIVSGGHTDLVLMKNHGAILWLGGTRDDAAGEAFDKIGRLLGLPYPGGPHIAQLSERGTASRFTFPRPMIDSNDFDFSFSGLKTAVLRTLPVILRSPKDDEESPTASAKRMGSFPRQGRGQDDIVNNLCASVQQAIIDVLVAKTIKAVQKYKVKSILLSGGVAANQKLRKQMHSQLSALSTKLYAPPAHLCTDNAAMIASCAFFNYHPLPLWKITADSELYF